MAWLGTGRHCWAPVCTRNQWVQGTGNQQLAGTGGHWAQVSSKLHQAALGTRHYRGHQLAVGTTRHQWVMGTTGQWAVGTIKQWAAGNPGTKQRAPSVSGHHRSLGSGHHTSLPDTKHGALGTVDTRWWIPMVLVGTRYLRPPAVSKHQWEPGTSGHWGKQAPMDTSGHWALSSHQWAAVGTTRHQQVPQAPGTSSTGKGAAGTTGHHRVQ